MTKTYDIIPQSGGFSITQDGAPLTSPQNRTLLLPTHASAEAVRGEWMQHGKFAAGKMPLTTITYTMMDKVIPQRDVIIETLMVYIDTDTLIYRSNSSQALLEKQQAQWDPVIAWLNNTIGQTWQTTQGVMPIEQSPALHDAMRQLLTAWSDAQLAANCLLAPCCSSVILAAAVTMHQCDAQKAYALSRLEEEFQAEIWGRDPDAQQRAARIREDALAAGVFLNLLKLQ